MHCFFINNTSPEIFSLSVQNRVQKRWRHKKLFFAFQHFGYHVSVEHAKSIHSPNLVGIGSWGPEIWPHKYLISPIEISVNWPGSRQLWTRPITLISMGLIRYSCGHISGHHEPIHVNGDWWFFIMFYWNMVMKMLKCKKGKSDDVTLHYSIKSEQGPVRVLCSAVSCLSIIGYYGSNIPYYMFKYFLVLLCWFNEQYCNETPRLSSAQLRHWAEELRFWKSNNLCNFHGKQSVICAY